MALTTERGWAGNHRREAQSGERPPAQGGQVRKWQMNLKGTGGVCIVISRMRHHDAERSARAMASPAEGLRWLTGAVSSWRVEHRASHARGPGAHSASELEARVLFSRGEGDRQGVKGASLGGPIVQPGGPLGDLFSLLSGFALPLNDLIEIGHDPPAMRRSCGKRDAK
jgi:hypothetical protein